MRLDKCICDFPFPNVVSGRCYSCGFYYRPDELPYEVWHEGPVDSHDNMIDPTMNLDQAIDPTEVAL